MLATGSRTHLSVVLLDADPLYVFDRMDAARAFCRHQGASESWATVPPLLQRAAGAYLGAATTFTIAAVRTHDSFGTAEGDG